MSKRRINVLIVEDDPTQGKSLYEAFTRAGYNAVLSYNGEQALAQAQRVEFQCIVMDCMLPRQNGVELTEKIQAMLPHQPKIFLLTGIFKDRKFMSEAINRTHAEGFFTKPLDLESLLASVATSMSKREATTIPPILKLYSSHTLEGDEMTALIEQEPTLHGFHLPKLLQRLHDTMLTGELNLVSTSGDVSSIGFYEGRIFAVKTPDEASYFGNLAVSLNFVSPAEVLEALNNPRGKMLGDRLIESMSLSPHAIAVIIEEQLALRLSQCIQDDVVGVQWISKKMNPPQHIMIENKFEHLIEDWLQSKVTSTWAKSTLMSWGPFLIEGDYHPRIKGPHTIEDLFSDTNFSEERDIQGLFRALVAGLAFMGARGEEVQDFTFLESRLDQMTDGIKSQNFFQFLGLSEKAQSREVTKAYEGLKEAFNPANLPKICPPDIRTKCEKVFAHIENCRKVLGDDVERMHYLQLLHNKRGQLLLEAEPIFRTAILEILSGKPKEAGKKFQSLLDRQLEFKDLRAYRIWAGLKESRHYSALRIDQIPPEERHSSAYMMAKGVYYRSRGQYKKAMDAFRTAHVLDPRLRIAKQEVKHMLNELESQKAGNKDLIREVTIVADTIFGKTKKGA